MKEIPTADVTVEYRLQQNPIFYQKQKSLINKNAKNNVPGILQKKDYDKSRGIALNRLPGGITRVNFQLIDKTKGKKYNFVISAGFIGVTQNKKTKALQSEIGWFVQKKQ